MKFILNFAFFIFFTLGGHFCNSQSSVEYDYVEYPLNQDVFIRWDIDLDHPITSVLLKNNKALPIEIGNNFVVFKNVNVLNTDAIAISFRNSANIGYDLEIPIIKRNGAIHTTNNVYDVIHPWTDKSISMLDELKNKSNLHPLEVYGFVQKFFNLSPNELFSITGNKSYVPSVTSVFESIKSTVFSKAGPPDPIFPPPIEADSCNCKLIITNTSAMNRPNNVSTTDSDVCTGAAPLDEGKNHEIGRGSDEDELVWTSQLGVSKGFLYFIQADGGDDIGTLANPNIRSLATTSFSRIRYKVVCANPLSIKPNNKCECTKDVHLEWEYASKYHWSIDDGWNIWGSDNSIYLEDWAIAALSLPGRSEILDQKMVSKRGGCDAQPIAKSFTELINVATSVQAAINAPTITSIITGAGNVLNFFGSIISEVECNSSKDSLVTLLQGTKEGIQLNPGEQLMFTIVSGSVLGGHIRNQGRATARIVSEGYLAGVLSSTEGPTKGCCSNEKIGSYALGSLSDFDFTKITNIRKRNKCSLQSNLDESIFKTSSPMGGFGSVAATVSSFLGINGPWGGAFDKTGCCDDVVVDCYSKCGVYRRCDSIDFELIDPTSSKIIKKFISDQSSKTEATQKEISVSDFKNYERIAFPNPTDGSSVFVNLKPNDQINKVIIYDQFGKQYNVSSWQKNGNTIQITPQDNFPSGVLIILLLDEHQKSLYHSKIIKL